jgi:hypothetical protein
MVRNLSGIELFNECNTIKKGIRHYMAHRLDPLKGDPHSPEQIKSRL